MSEVYKPEFPVCPWCKADQPDVIEPVSCIRCGREFPKDEILRYQTAA